MSTHADQEHILKRLKRAEGHLKSVIAMIEGGKPCMAVAQQLHAVIGALENTQHVFIESHINGCLQDVLRNPDGAKQILDDFKTITKYLK